MKKNIFTKITEVMGYNIDYIVFAPWTECQKDLGRYYTLFYQGYTECYNFFRELGL